MLGCDLHGSGGRGGSALLLTSLTTQRRADVEKLACFRGRRQGNGHRCLRRKCSERAVIERIHSLCGIGGTQE